MATTSRPSSALVVAIFCALVAVVPAQIADYSGAVPPPTQGNATEYQYQGPTNATSTTNSTGSPPEYQSIYTSDVSLGPVVPVEPVQTIGAEYGNLVYQGPSIKDDISGEYGGVEYTGLTSDGLTALMAKRSDDIDVQGKCIVWGDPASVRTFDGRGYSFQGHGEFVLYQHQKHVEQINIIQHRIGLLSHITGAAFRFENHTFSIQMERVLVGNDTRVQPVMRFDDQDVTEAVLSPTPVTLGNFTIQHEGQLDKVPLLMIDVGSSSGASMIVTVHNRFGGHHFNVFVEVPGSAFEKTQGLCGHYDLDPANDMRDRNGLDVAGPADVGNAWLTGGNASLWGMFTNLPTGDVLDAVVTPAALNKTRGDVLAAVRACLEVGSDFRIACVFNVLAAGNEAADEARAVETVATDSIITIDEQSKTCLARAFTLGAWKRYNNCSASCGMGYKTRDRLVYERFVVDEQILEQECGSLRETKRCYTVCDKAPVWARCGDFSHILTFDGKMYDVQAAGEFLLYRSVDLKEQVNVIKAHPKPNASMILTMGAAYRFGPDVFEVTLKEPRYEEPVFRFNGEVIANINQNDGFGFYTVSRSGNTRSSSNNDLVVEVSIPGGNTMTVVFFSPSNVSRVGVFVEINGNGMGATKGLCGSFDYNPQNDLIDADGVPQTQGAVSGWSWRQSQTDSLFSDAPPKQIAPVSFEEFAPTNITENSDALDAAYKSCSAALKFRKFLFHCVMEVAAFGVPALSMLGDIEAVLGTERFAVPNTKVAQCLDEPGTKLGPWTVWSACSRSCGTGIRTRSRKVRMFDGTECGEVLDTATCVATSCPVDCVLSEWGNWTNCSVDCGNGQQTREKVIITAPAYGGKSCESTVEARACVATGGCCVLGEWNSWGTCFQGIQNRTRTVSPRPSCGQASESRPCCDIGPWGAWGKCKKGLRRRKRNVYGPASCGVKIDTEECCTIGTWSGWGGCNAGRRNRTRNVQGPDRCGAKIEFKDCCSVGEWRQWSECDRGRQFRARTVDGPSWCPKGEESRPCCSVGEWQAWGECLKGSQIRERTIEGPKTCGHTMEKRECCSFGPWSAWSPCNGDGRQQRIRSFIGPASCAPLQEVQACAAPVEATPKVTPPPGETASSSSAATAVQSAPRYWKAPEGGSINVVKPKIEGVDTATVTPYVRKSCDDQDDCQQQPRIRRRLRLVVPTQ